MLEIVQCNQCSKEGMFDIHLQFTWWQNECGTCKHSKPLNWDYYFCNLECFLTWMKENEIEEKGFPCRSCRNNKDEPTGFAWGFESNGICKICNGTKRVNNKYKCETMN